MAVEKTGQLGRGDDRALADFASHNFAVPD